MAPPAVAPPPEDTVPSGVDGFSPSPSGELPQASPPPAPAPELGHAERPPSPKRTPKQVAALTEDSSVARRRAEAGARSLESAPASFFTVQVRATQSMDDANHFLGKLKADGFHAFVTEVDIEGKGHWYRVRVGKFDTRPKAEKYLSDFKRETHLQAFVTAAGH